MSGPLFFALSRRWLLGNVGHLSTWSRACVSRSVSGCIAVLASAILHREPKYTRWVLDTLVGCFLESSFARAFQQRRAQANFICSAGAVNEFY